MCGCRKPVIRPPEQPPIVIVKDVVPEVPAPSPR